jgi:hypothetical protein
MMKEQTPWDCHENQDGLQSVSKNVATFKVHNQVLRNVIVIVVLTICFFLDYTNSLELVDKDIALAMSDGKLTHDDV